MTGFVCLLDRSGTEADPLLLRRLAEPLGIYGGTLSDLCRGPVGMAIVHRYESVAPERFGPVSDPDTGVMAAVGGRMSPVGDSLDGHATGKHLHDPLTAPQALDAFLRKGIRVLAGTAGGFVFMTGDPRQGALTIARDHLGSYKLYYYLDRHWLIAASDPAAILRHPSVSNEIDEGMVSRFLGFRFSHTVSSFFRSIKELPPAHWLRVTALGSETGQYWRFKTGRNSGPRTREQVQADFRALLGRSVTREMSGLKTDQVAISLSGGLDSTAVAALSPPGTRLCSWYFTQTPDCDESLIIEKVGEYLRRPVNWTRGDGLYPLSGDYIDGFVHPNSPHLNAFASLKCRLYQSAKEAGCKHILVGDAGDTLYSAGDYWLRDLLLNPGLGAVRSLIATIGAAAQGDDFARLALRRLLPVRHVRKSLGRVRLPWLTGTARAALPSDKLSPILPPGGRKYRFEPGVGSKHIELESEERRLFAQCGVERGNPFWYWPLLETVLDLPAYWFYRDGRAKVLTREAMRGLLPDHVFDSPPVGLLGTFFLRGMEINKDVIRDMVVRNPRSDWRRYVKEPWIEPYLSETRRISFGHTILWRVISYELWYRRLIQ